MKRLSLLFALSIALFLLGGFLPDYVAETNLIE